MIHQLKEPQSVETGRARQRDEEECNAKCGNKNRRERALSARDERGVILLVVLAMLQLLALLGLTFTVYAAHGGPADAIARVEQEIERAQTALTALLENPDDASLQESALVSVGDALWESSAITDGSETRTPETQRLDGLLHAAHALFEHLCGLATRAAIIVSP